MRVIDGIKRIKGRPGEIPDCSRDDFPQLFKDMGFKVGAEAGVYKGNYSEVLCQAGLQVYSIDPWMSMEGCVHPRGQNRQNDIYEQARERLSKYPNNIIVRKTSMEALKDFKDNGLDFVYIDANHKFPFVAEDLYWWSYKVKKGGIICGHDYAYFEHRAVGAGCQVREVVDAFAKSFELDFWVLGRRKVKEGEKRDQFRSWMFLKNWKNVQ